MRKLFIAASAIALLALPVSAGMLDMAKTVLKGKSVLKKAESTCGSAMALSQKENSTIDFAVAAVTKAVPQKDFLSLSSVANAETATESAAPGFCADTKKNKSGILSKISKAGKNILLKKVGF